MKKSIDLCKRFFSHLFLVLVLILSIEQTTVSQIENTESALAAFSGKNLTQKKGPLAKVGFDLALLREEFRHHTAKQSAARFVPSNLMLPVVNDRVIVDVTVRGDIDFAETELKSLGMSIEGKAGGIVSGFLPINSIEAVAAIDRVRFVHPAMRTTRSGIITSQGDVSMRSNVVRTTLGYNGTGVTVGVLSDSYNYLGDASSDVNTGDLPGAGNPNGFTTPVTVLQDDGSTDEGRAMLQLVHDIAPGAQLAFATAFLGQASFANNITNLRTVAGVDVIVDDVIYFAEPMFQDGVIAQAVDDAVAAGVPYFSSAGNNGRDSYESVWRSGPTLAGGSLSGTFYGGTTFDFDPGPGTDNKQSFTLGNGQTILISLQWDSPFASVCSGCPGSVNDLDIYLLNSNGNQVLASSAYDNIDADAYEVVQFTNNTGSSATFNILIANYSGANPGFLKYVNFGSSQGSLQFATNSSTLFGHANAKGAEAVGAAAYFDTPAFGAEPPVLESYSSAGPTAIRFTKTGSDTIDARADKPEITAPDGTNTTFFGFDYEGDTYPNFFGTSAAAPHAAAVAALMLDKFEGSTPDQIYSSLESNTIDIGTAGFDNNSGFGLIQADAAMDGVLPVELFSFNAQSNLNEVQLRWNTSTEMNNFGFEIEKIKNQNTEVRGQNTTETWIKIGFVAGSGTTNASKEYFFTDKNISTGKYSYRLKQIDRNGKFSYSQPVEVECGSTPNRFALMQNYPNPFNPSTLISFQIPVNGHIVLKVYDAIGREVVTLVNEIKDAGYYTAMFNASKLSSGIYFAKLQSSSIVQIKKMSFIK